MKAIVSNSSGDALFSTALPHGIVDGDYLYVRSNIENYNGFWYVEEISTTSFKIKPNATDAAVLFIQGVNVEYFETNAAIPWSCIHLPIVYEIESDLFPENNVNTARTVSSFTNDNGLINLNLSGALGAFSELDFVKIEGAASAEVVGIFQVLDKISTSDITINLAYNAQYSFAGATVILFYSNYHVIVEVYAGISDLHTWADQKPYELAATLKFVPGTDNRIKFSINEILKAYVENKNNLALGTLPNNIDAWVNFYVRHAESYDLSNGYTVATFQSGFTQDAFEGFGMNAQLPFKNIYSGHLSEYVMRSGIVGKFLTLFAVPVLFACSDGEECYQDISFILDTKNIIDTPPMASYSDDGSGAIIWSITDQPSVTIPSTDTSNVLFNTSVSIDPGTYRLRYKVNIDQEGSSVQLNVSFRGTDSILYTNAFFISDPGVNTVDQSLSLPFGATEIRFSAVNNEATDRTVTLLSFGVELDYDNVYIRQIFFNDEIEQLTTDVLVEPQDSGVYRMPLSNDHCNQEYDSMKAYVFGESGFYGEETILSEIKTFELDCACADYTLRLCWQNNLGGFDYWLFKEPSELITDIGETGEQRTNILPMWPKSFGEFSDTINRQTFRESRKQIRVRSQYVSRENLDALAYIKESILVQIINSRLDRRTVIVDADSFTRYQEDDDQFSIEFTITFTDDNPVQRV